ncbi:hypothetical protein H2200_010157 [Cladophialophora chaetospira]|uniref:Transcription factor domain-containing protein n=1 Tax=Cladophialophora chaetospira TaxID=386627 RepID=A0AA38X2G2_9EURO|nr:hypothetical protein H2200_010157 [Cladophialophora chaetospira]
MAKDLTIQIRFVYDRSSRVLSKKQYQEQEVEALSHAAKVSHRRKRQRWVSPPTKQSQSSHRCDDSSTSDSSPETSPTTTSSPLTRYHLDPLFNVPHPRSGSYYRAMDIWFQWILPNAAPAFIIFNVSNIFEYYFSSPGCQSEAAQHCIAALAYGCLQLHRKETDAWEYDYNQEQLKHNALAISLLKKDVASKRAAANRPSAINTILLLSFLATERTLTGGLGA